MALTMFLHQQFYSYYLKYTFCKLLQPVILFHFNKTPTLKQRS